MFVTFGCVITYKRWTTTRTNKKTTNWNSLLRHSSYDEKARKKKNPQINSVSPLKREKISNFFFLAWFVHKSRKRGGRPGSRGGLSAVGPADGARGARGKRDLETNTFKTIGSSVRDERRYDRSEDEKQIEPIIIKSTHRFLCTRQAKIRSKRRRETDGTYHHQVNTYVSLYETNEDTIKERRVRRNRFHDNPTILLSKNR